MDNRRDKETHSIFSIRGGRSEKNDNIVEIYGDIGGVSKDVLEMYLENRKRSGGGAIKEIDLQANPPRIVFDDAEGKLFSQINRAFSRNIRVGRGAELSEKF